MMFRFVVDRLGFLKHVPPLPFIFEGIMQAFAFLLNPRALRRLDAIELEVRSWDGVTAGVHKYGGLQFDHLGRELGHIHANGLLDVWLTRSVRDALVAQGRARAHHVLRDSGWVSYPVASDEDVADAIGLLWDEYLRRLSGRTPRRKFAPDQ